MNYKLTTRAAILRVEDGANILVTRIGGSQPVDPDGIDGRNLLAWLAAGNTPVAADPDPGPTQDQLDAAAAKAYNKLQALMTMTPAQVQTWVANNVTSLAAAQDAITTLAIAVSVLARRL